MYKLNYQLKSTSKMKNKNFIPTLFLIISLFLSSGCTTVSYETIYPTLKDGKYDSEFPYKSTSDELKKISETVHRINTTAFYKIYVFDANDNFTLPDLKDKRLDKIAVKEILADNSGSGTAVTVYSQNGNVALLTCAHTISYPDTIISYRLDDFGITTKYVESVSLKEKQVIYAAGFPEGSLVDVLLQNDQMDLALLGKKYGSQAGVYLPVFNYPMGRAKEVEWGTFVYLVGFPINFKMITKAIISSPMRDENGAFIVDAVINPGFSGGLVLAIRDGVPNFEFIGLVQWVPEDTENMMVPEALKNNSSYNPVVPYKGDTFVRKHSTVKYGIAKIIPVETVLNFINQNKDYLIQEGYYIFQ